MLCKHPDDLCSFELLDTHPDFAAGGPNHWAECLRCRASTHRYRTAAQALRAKVDVPPAPRWTVPPVAE